jgi:hypothetical protein
VQCGVATFDSETGAWQVEHVRLSAR